MHLVKAFTHLQVDKIPGKYVLKRYTRGARSVVEWDRNDVAVWMEIMNKLKVHLGP
jgi:hypothetical protein